MNRYNNFTFIHMVAAFLVLLGHQFVLTGNSPPLILGIDANGLGVRILFLVSGYLVSGSYIRTKKRGIYFAKRIIRLYPPLIVCLILTVLCLFPFSDNKQYYWLSAKDYFLFNLRMYPKFDLAGVFIHNPYSVSINGSLWTLPIELACYILLVPFIDIFNLVDRHNKIAASCILVALLAGLMIYTIILSISSQQTQAIFYGTDWHAAIKLILFFLIGATIYLLKLERYFQWQIALVGTMIYLGTNGIIRLALMPIIVCYNVMSFGFAEKPLFVNTFKKDICYGLYLFGFPAQQLMIYFFSQNGKPLQVYPLFFYSLIVSWILAELTNRLIENPITRVTDKLIKKRISQ